MSMTPDRFRAAVNSLDDDELERIIAALGRARQTAMEQSVRARIPECASFGDIAQDMEYVTSRISDEALVVNEASFKSACLESAAKEKGLKVSNFSLTEPAVGEISGLPVAEGEAH